MSNSWQESRHHFCVLINNCLPIHMYPHFILSDNWTEFKNQLMDNVLTQLGIGCIFSAPYHPQSNGKLEVFHKYLKLILNKLCENGPDNWENIHQPNISHLLCDITPCNCWNIFLPSLWKRSQSTPHQLLEIMQWFLGDPELGHLDLKSHHLALPIAKMTLDENWFKHAQKTTDCTHLILKLVTEYNLKNNHPGKWDLKWSSWLQDCLYSVQWTLPPYRKPSYRKN